MTGGVRGDFEDAEVLPAQSKRAGGGGCFEARIVERAGAGYGERELAGNFKIAAADPADLRDVDSKLVGVESEFLGVEVVAAGGGKISACFGDMGRRHLEDVMGQRSFNPEACNGFAVDNAAVHRDGARAFQIAERAACVDLRIEWQQETAGSRRRRDCWRRRARGERSSRHRLVADWRGSDEGPSLRARGPARRRVFH